MLLDLHIADLSSQLIVEINILTKIMSTALSYLLGRKLELMRIETMSSAYSTLLVIIYND